MRMIPCNGILLMATILLLQSSLCAAEGVKANPHSDKGDCSLCHVASADKLRGWFVLGSTKRELNDDLNKVCQKCHTVEPSHGGGFMGVDKGHAIGKRLTYNKGNLPLAGDGTITCATTCHNMHVSQDERQLHIKHLRLPVNDLCMSCHNL